MTVRGLRVAIPPVLLVALGVLLFQSTGRDDSYITFWEAHALDSLGTLVNYNGEHIEQSSSLLMTIVLAAGARLTSLRVELLGPVVGVLGGAALVVVCARAAERIREGSGIAAGLVAATSAYVVYWSFSGMETALSATMLLLALWSVAVYVDDGRRLWALAASALAAALARPESGYVLAATSVALLAWLVFAPRRRRDVDAASGSPRRSAIACAVVGLALAAPAAFRQAFFDQPVPQPVRAKVGGLEIERGLDYLWRWGARPYVLVLGVLVAVWLLRLRGERRSLPVLLTLALGAHVGFVVLSGGDWMEAGRFLVPAVALAAVMTGVVINRNRLALAAIVLLQLAGVLHVAANDSTGLPFWSDLQPREVREAAGTLDSVASRNRVHARDALFLPVLDGAVAQLHDQLDRPVTIASGQAGFVPYGLATERYGEFRFIDLGNLSTRNFAACDEGLRRGLLGLAMSMPYWIAHLDECDLPLPDLLYQLGRFDATDPSVQRAFVLVEQVDVGPIRASSKLLAGADVSSAEFLAVRRDLADLLDTASDG